MRRILLAAAALAAALPTAVQAKPEQTRQFKASDSVSINPAKAYILIRMEGGLDIRLLRVATDAERSEYATERTAALEKAKAKYVRAKAGYDADVATWNKARPEDRALMVRPEKPVEPTDANFAFRAIESDKFATVWAGRIFDKPTGARLLEVQPGLYRLYGQMLETQNGAAGFCLCMGSVQFEAAPGKITDLGTIHYPMAEALRAKAEPSWNGLTPGRGGLTAMRVAPDEAAVPAKLVSLPRVPADYRAAGKIDNFFGVMVDRLTALPGVLAYNRDQVIDERTGAAVTD